MKTKLKHLAPLIALLAAAPQAGYAESILKKALVDDSSHYLNFKYRIESAEQSGLSRDAVASTLRTTLGYESGELHGFSANIELMNVSKVGNDLYNDKQMNGEPNRPVVADPDVTELTLAHLNFNAIPETQISVGRQLRTYDNQRFLGSNEWRQLRHAFDSAYLSNQSIEDLNAQYLYIDEYNSSMATSENMNSHFANISYDGFEGLVKLTGYGYFLEYEDMAAWSRQTIGGSLTGTLPVNEATNFTYRIEYAEQSDYGNNASSFDANYYIGEVGIGQSNWNVSAAYEVLGSDDGGAGFETRLGLLHKHNGWADVFLGGTPDKGLIDKNIKASYTLNSENMGLLNGVKLGARYHMFEAEHGGASYGDEVNFLMTKNFMENYSATFKMADYRASSDIVTGNGLVHQDVQKLWLILGAKF